MAESTVRLFANMAQNGIRVNMECKGWDTSILLRFWKADSKEVSLKIEASVAEEMRERLVVGEEFWAIFETNTRVRTFRSHITFIHVDETGRALGLRVATPAEVSTEDRRRAYRIPKVSPNVARAAVTTGGKTYELGILNLFVVGVLGRLDRQLAEDLPEDAAYKIKLTTAADSIVIGAVFRRRTPYGSVAFEFPGSYTMGELSPKPALARIVRNCELRWLRKRTG